MSPRPPLLPAAALCAVLAGSFTTDVAAAETGLTLAGVRDVKLLDSGSLVVSGVPPFAREEVFEFLQRPDGGVTLLSSTTRADGSLRVQSRYDYDPRWQSLAATGLGLYGDEPVRIELEARAGAVAIRVRGAATAIDSEIPCPRGCLLDMAPSGTPMFVMTRLYDRVAGGSQSFQWAAQDLTQANTSPPNQTAALRLRREVPLQRADGSTLTIHDFEMIERIPTPDGGVFVMEFDLWTDVADRPMGFRINRTGGRPSTAGIVGFRRGYEDIRAQLVATQP